MPDLECRYQCWRCKQEFMHPKPKPVICKFCGHNYLTWLNCTQVLDAIRRWNPAEVAG